MRADHAWQTGSTGAGSNGERACGFDGIGVLVEGGDDEVGQQLVAARKYR
jgi:hypothetical protein